MKNPRGEEASRLINDVLNNQRTRNDLFREAKRNHSLLFGSGSIYRPHQGKKEIARRKRQMEKQHASN